MGREVVNVEVVPIDTDRFEDLGSLLCSQPESSGCWCMWFISRVADYHSRGAAGNRAAFVDLLNTSPTPVGLLAYDGDAAVGWCAVGPRSRFARAIKTPTLKGRDSAEDDDVWMVPCFLVHPSARRRQVATTLLRSAVALAKQHGATAVEGFPLAGDRTRSKSADFMTGTEPLFASCGFGPVRRPSENRVIMRRDLGPAVSGSLGSRS